MKVLVVGAGGREHALAWKLAQSSRVSQVFVAPGNGGTALEAGVQNIPVSVDDTRALIHFAREEGIALTVIGPEGPLVEGVVDHFREAGLRCFGPGREAAQLEGSKSFAKSFLFRHNIPTAGSRTFSNPHKAKEWIREQGAPVVIKADGLAAGKGVTVAMSVDEALQAVDEILVENRFGEAGALAVVEEWLEGEEASFICMVNGQQVLPLATSQDHKARDEGDKGPNTGGMGAYSPAPVVTPQMHQHIMADVIEPTVRGLIDEGIHYTGFLYAGLMVSPEGVPRVLEFNCRFGDPETQPVLMRLESDLADLIDAALDGNLDSVEASWRPEIALGVVLAAGGYPGTARKGDLISGVAQMPPSEVKVFHAGSHLVGEDVVTDGGRVLCVTALGSDVRQAREHAYRHIDTLDWPQMFFRRDIGYRAVARENNDPVTE